ncbi:MAG: hypothetical protein KDC54_17165 [Lewinella sp.]|nr:hypothetical protein [Lewinella sp.]
MNRTIYFLCIFLSVGILRAQDFTYRTFKDSRVVNVHSVETLGKGRLDVRISHRFGDLAGERGGWTTFYGLEQATDVAIGAEYGISDRLTVGLYRSKGAGESAAGNAGLRQLLNGILKYRLIRQRTDDVIPFSATLVGLSSFSTAERIEGNEDLIRSFPKFAHRFAFHGQLVLGRKFGDGFSLQLIPGYTHRNLVPFEDRNGMFSLGGAMRLQLSRTFGLVADATFPLIDSRTADQGYYPAIGVGLEIETSGHVFQVNFTNATGIMETDFVPYTTSNWLDGEFRLGFTISRLFNL